MLRKKSKAVPEGNGPVPHQDEFESHQPTMADFYQRTIRSIGQILAQDEEPFRSITYEVG